MRMKLYSAPTREGVLAQIQLDMGADAVILFERETDDGYEARAAIERASSIVAPNFANKKTEAPQLQANRYSERLKEILLWHGAPEGFAQMIATSGSRLTGAPTDPAAGFSSALEGVIGCSPIPPSPARPIMLVGPPGSGKTSTTAKLVRRARAANARVNALVGDFDATAAPQQLSAYMHHQGPKIASFDAPDDLAMGVEALKDKGVGVVIDTPAINPNDKEDLNRLGDLINMLDAEPVLVISAEGHPLDLEDNVRAFAGLGINRCIVTKLDVVRRRGGVLFAIASARMNLSHMALTPFIGGGLIPATPNRLARVLLEDAPGAETLKGAA